MSEGTGIPWADDTLNLWWGCMPVSAGCQNCYARAFAHRLGRDGLWGEGHSFQFASEPYWKKPLKWNAQAEKAGQRRRVFVNSMSDFFEERSELDEHRERFFDLVPQTPWIDYLLLTKREGQMQLRMTQLYLKDLFGAYGYTLHDPLSNLQLGVTVEDIHYVSRVDALRATPAAVRYISAEPLLGSLFKSEQRREVYAEDNPHDRLEKSIEVSNIGCKPLDLTGIDQVIAGCESGARRRPMELDWVRELRDACLNACPGCGGRGWYHDLQTGDQIQCGCRSAFEPSHRPAFFFKQAITDGRKVEMPKLDGKVWDELPRAA